MANWTQKNSRCHRNDGVLNKEKGLEFDPGAATKRVQLPDEGLPAPAGVYRVHRLSFMAAEGLREFVEILNAPVGTPFAG